MKIKIKDDAAKIYLSRFKGQQIPNREWGNTLMKIQGLTLDVETEFLFKDQYNTAPIPGVSETGLRVMQESVAEVIDDIRNTRKFCGWCNHHSDINASSCGNCKKTEYFKSLMLKKRLPQ